MKKNIFNLFLLFTALSVANAQGYSGKAPFFDRETLHCQADEESLKPVRPGIPGESPFWNVNSSRFIFVPSFDFNPVPGAQTYRFVVASESDGKEYVFQAEKPWATLAPVWRELPVGFVSLEVTGLDNTGKVVGTAGKRRFYRAAVFNGPYHENQGVDYRDSASRALRFLLKSNHLQKWLSEGSPDSTYLLYCYPSKMVSAIIQGMLLFSRLSPNDSTEALTVAWSAGKYLISVSEPAGSRLEFFPPTYDPGRMEYERYKDWPAYEYRYQIMLIYPPRVGMTYLDLYDATGDSCFLNAARRIADTFAKIQLGDGNWPLKIDIRTGEALGTNFARAGTILDLFRRLKTDYGINTYDNNIHAAQAIYVKPFENFNFEGQFEDVEPSQLYQNLSHYTAVEASGYFLDHAKENADNLDKALEYLRFAEDQFIVWERPCPVPRPEREDRRSDDWITPCALEQYHYYVPIDASAANFISVFLKAYQVTGDKLFLAKAVSLANSMLKAQDRKTGRYPTYWWKANLNQIGWINCAISSAEVMNDLGNFLD